MRKSFALASVAGTLCTVALAQAQVGTAGPPLPPMPAPDAAPPTKPIAIQPDDKHHSLDLRDIADRSGKVFDAVLVRKATGTPPGMRILVTEYTFQVHEWFKGSDGSRTITVRETGGLDPAGDGGGMATVHSHNLTLNGRYLVFLEPDAADLLFPIDRVYQVLDAGAKVADETGRYIVGLNGSVPILRRTAEVPGLSYLGSTPSNELQSVSGPTTTFDPPRPVAPPAEPPQAPIPAEELFRLLRAPGTARPAGPGPAGLNAAGLGGPRWNYCGYITGSQGARNFAAWLPDNNNFNWFNDGEIYWDQDVNWSGSGGWIFGWLYSGGNPIRNEAPVANNNRDNAGYPSDAQMTAGGYGTWAANGSPNGICFFWFTGGNCTRIREADVFMNPVNAANELQSRKSIVHEMGHSIGLGHEDRYYADMVSGTWRVVPNYNFGDYLRLDDRQGGRAVMLAANNGLGGTWSLANYRDIATYGQSHPNVGTSGDIGPNVVQLSTYSINAGQSLTVSRLHVENRGRTAYSGAVSFNMYLSTDTTITSGDINIYSGGWANYGAEAASYNFPLNVTIPASTPTGTYYVGWIVSAGEAELAGGNNTALMVRDSSGGFAPRPLFVTNTIPANNTCNNAIPTVPGGTYTGSTAAATNNGASSCGASGTSPDVYFSFTAPCAGTLAVDTCGSNYDTVLALHSACPATTGNQIACNDDDCFCGGSPCRQSLITQAVSAGTTYIIRVTGFSGLTGNYTLHVNFSANTPTNNTCATAAIIGNGTFVGSTDCATSDGSASCGASASSPDVWYRYTAPGTGSLHVDTCGSAYDTVLSVHTGCPGTTANQLACNDDSCGLQSVLDVPVVNGQNYYIRVSGFNGSTGSYTLHTGFAPANDSCSNWIAITNGNTPFTTVGATTDGPTEPNCSFCCGDPQVNQDIWYRYTATCTGTATLQTCGATWDTKLAVYAGGCPVSPGTAIACNDDSCGLQSLVTFPTTAGAVYTIRVGGFATATGSGTLSLACAPLSCYANCDGSTTIPFLNILDFNCFLNKFAAGHTYANCDGSTLPPVLNILDFNCFLNKFAAGCSAP